MSERKKSRITAGTGILLVAVLLFGGSLAVAVTREHRANAPAPVGASPPGADSDPLAALERGAREKPGDVATWSALGQHYFDAGRYPDAVAAYDRATQLDGSKAALWSALGEARVMASAHDPMPAAAVTDFDKALAADPRDPRARYFQAVRKDLAGDHAAAMDGWLALLADTPVGAPWEADLRRTIEQVGKINHIAFAERMGAIKQPGADPAQAALAAARPASGDSPALAGIPGPTTEQLQAAAAIPPSQQDAMAQSMVARLEARLKDQPRDADGWVMLMRSRMMLNQPDKASAALASAVAANPAQAGRLREQATVLGVH